MLLAVMTPTLLQMLWRVLLYKTSPREDKAGITLDYIIL